MGRRLSPLHHAVADDKIVSGKPLAAMASAAAVARFWTLHTEDFFAPCRHLSMNKGIPVLTKCCRCFEYGKMLLKNGLPRRSLTASVKTVSSAVDF